MPCLRAVADLILGSHPHVLQLGETVKESVDVTVTMPAASVKEDPMQGKQTKFVTVFLGKFYFQPKGLGTSEQPDIKYHT